MDKNIRGRSKTHIAYFVLYIQKYLSTKLINRSKTTKKSKSKKPGHSDYSHIATSGTYMISTKTVYAFSA